MPNYHRLDLPGGTFFITIVTYKRLPILTHPRAREILHDAWEVVTKRLPFTTDAICLLPEHIHALITLPEDDANISIRIREIKRLFTKAYLSNLVNRYRAINPGSKKAKRPFGKGDSMITLSVMSVIWKHTLNTFITTR